MPSNSDVAVWMLEEFEKEGVMYQDVIVSIIERDFGESFVYINRNGNLAIKREVLDEFRKLTNSTAVWISSGRYWRRREEHEDSSSRRSS